MTTIRQLYGTREEAERAIENLKGCGLGGEHISVIVRDKQDQADLADIAGATRGAAEGAVVGGGLGALAGLAVGLGVITIPGIGPVLAAGPILSALGAGGLGAIAGGITGAVADLGLEPEEARAHQEGLAKGGVLLVVQADEEAEPRVREALALTATGKARATPPLT